MNDMIMVPAGQWGRLQEYYKGQVTSNALLDQVGVLGATEHAILNNKTIPDSMAVKLAKPLARKRRNLTKRLKTGLIGDGGGTYGTTVEEPEAMVDTPSEALVKRLIKRQASGSPQTSTTPKLTKKRKAELLAKAKKISAKKAKTEPKPGSSGMKKSVIKGATKGLLSSFGQTLTDSEDEDTDLYGSALTKKQKAKGKKPKKSKKSQADKLHFSEPPKGKLHYDTDWESWE